MPLHRFLLGQTNGYDPLGESLLVEAHAAGFTEVDRFECRSLYLLEGYLTASEKKQLISDLLQDSISQVFYQDTLIFNDVENLSCVEWILKPGIMDPVAQQILISAKLFNIHGITRASSGQHIIIHAREKLPPSFLHTLAQRLLVNASIHHYTLGIFTELPILSLTPTGLNFSDCIPLRHLSANGLNALSDERRSALDLTEMQAIQYYYKRQERDPTSMEFEAIAQTWSEHCSHKTFRAHIQYGDLAISGLLNTYIRQATDTINAPWVACAFVDNAGIIDFDEDFQIAFKVETHNHPSAIEPFGGANTGMGGVIRDILGVSATPFAATDIFCLGPQSLEFVNLPRASLHPRLIQSGVVAGVQDYGNKTGIPTVNGAVIYDKAYTANPLVYCGCIGLLPKNSHPRAPSAGDRVILIGGKTGRDGLRGATFSSMAMDVQTGEVAGASVQLGNPILAKGLIDVVTRARDAKLYHAITDCGAGGLSSAVGEMANGLGARLEIEKVPLKYPGLLPWEIWLSEAQERMILAVPEENIASLTILCEIYEVEITDIGVLTKDNQLSVYYNQQNVLQLDNEFLFGGMPRKQFSLTQTRSKKTILPSAVSEKLTPQTILLNLLAHPSIASKENIIRRYDHEVQGGTVIKPLIGVLNDGPSDACVIKPLGTKGLRGLVISNGINPELGKYDPYHMAWSVIDEAIRNAVSVGADPNRIAILDNFCWGDPNRSEGLADLIECARGCHDAAVYYGTPFISGKDSLNNEYNDDQGNRYSIPGTLLISALGIIPDITKAVSMDFKTAGNYVYQIGETFAELLGSHFNLCGGNVINTQVPQKSDLAPQVYKVIHESMQNGWIRACHDMSEGGLAVSVAEMCLAGRLGCNIELATQDWITQLFSESQGRFVVEIEAADKVAFERYYLAQLPSRALTLLGRVTDDNYLRLEHGSQESIILSIDELVQAWQSR